MPDDVVGTDHNDDVASEHTNAAAIETVIIDFTAAERLIAELRNICAADHSPSTRKTLAVLALYQFVSLANGMEPGPPQLMLEFLPPKSAKLYTEIIRGMVAAVVAWLRETYPDGVSLEKAIDARIEARKPKYVLGFTGAQAARWFHRCEEGSAPRVMAQVFRSYRPAPSQSPTPDAATRRAIEIFDAVCLMNAWPLAQPRRNG